MNRIVIGTLALATVIACVSSAKNDAASPNAKQETTTTGATVGGTQQRASSPTAAKQQTFSGTSANDESSFAEPGAPKTPPLVVGVPRTPAPANTGDPCPSCPERR